MKLRIFLLVHETIVAMISSVKNSSNAARGVGVTLAFGRGPCLPVMRFARLLRPMFVVGGLFWKTRTTSFSRCLSTFTTLSICFRSSGIGYGL